MSLLNIRVALEKRLAALTPNISTAYENTTFTSITGVPYQKIAFLPAEPDNSIMGSSQFIERGIFQVTLCYPIGTGPAAAEAQSWLIRDWFKRGNTFTEAGQVTVIMKTPRVSAAIFDGDRYTLVVSITFQSQTATP